MRVVIAPDSFKEGCGAKAAAEAIARGWLYARPLDTLTLVPMADGGEGTVDAVAAAWRVDVRQASVCGPLGAPVVAAYALDTARGIAVIEMASASGLPLVPKGQRDPRVTTTRGTGELIARALDEGAKKVVVGVGGSATNDGGVGALRALGYHFYGSGGEELPEGGAALANLQRIDGGGIHTRLRDVELQLACDVRNPLCGPDGASAVYGPQKGASPEVVRELDAALSHFAAVVRESTGSDYAAVPGSGAAGGLSFGLMSLAGARLRSGVEVVAEAVGLDEQMAGAGLVITGEGRLDAQTVNGKTPHGVAQIAARHAIPVIALAGQLGPGYEALFEHGICAAYAISPPEVELAAALRDTEKNLERVAREVASAWWD
jgi:glycerate kinase